MKKTTNNTTTKRIKRTKTGDILRHMRRYGSITDPIARDKYHTNRLSGIIANLRKQGYVIETVMKDGHDEYGKNSYGKYYLKSEK